jgi:hypothetical protein
MERGNKVFLIMESKKSYLKIIRSRELRKKYSNKRQHNIEGKGFFLRFKNSDVLYHIEDVLQTIKNSFNLLNKNFFVVNSRILLHPERSEGMEKGAS